MQHLQKGLASGPGERDDILDVFHASHVHHQPLEAQSEAGVRYRAVAAQIKVPLQPLLLQPLFRNQRLQLPKIIFAGGATNELTDLRVVRVIT